jgi:AbiV family abortive infection protein
MKKIQDSRLEYNSIARLAYENAIELLDEARLLLREKNSPRAFTLAVASIEELMKSFLADLIWKGSAKPEDLRAELKGKNWPILTSHGSKHRFR